MNYIDDFISAEKWDTVWDSYYELGNLIARIGAKEAVDKASPPDTQVVCLGVLMDTLLMIMKVTPERVIELHNLLEQWRFMKHATRKQLESLVGKLQFIANCVRQGRVFIARLLNWLHTMERWGHPYEIPFEARLDMKWWYLFLSDSMDKASCGTLMCMRCKTV